MDPLVAAIDQGTSSTRFLVSDVSGLMNCLGVFHTVAVKRLLFTLFRHLFAYFLEPKLKTGSEAFDLKEVLVRRNV